jgi:hypothetical protein
MKNNAKTVQNFVIEGEFGVDQPIDLSSIYERLIDFFSFAIACRLALGPTGLLTHI